MVDKQFKKFIDAGKTNTRILGAVERHIIAKPKDKTRITTVLHPSDMADPGWCHRASYFHLQGKEAVTNKTMTLNLASVFEEGHAIHKRWQKWFEEMGVLYGAWDCRTCGRRVWATSEELDAESVYGDEHCGPWSYAEVPLDYKPLRIVGHADGWIKGMGNPLMLEIKSIGDGTLRWECPELYAENNYDFNKTWNSITTPFMKHVQQVQIYMKLAELIGYENYPKEAVIIYEAKPNQKHKEFVIPKSDFGVKHIFEAAQKIMNCLKQGVPPYCNVKSNGCERCKSYDS
jgi:hypothetical protein